VRPPLQTLIAALLAPTLAAPAMLVLILGSKSERYAIVGVGLSPEGLIPMVLYLLLVGGLHWAAGQSRRLTPHRPMLFRQCNNGDWRWCY
jgi:hypothetical protein